MSVEIVDFLHEVEKENQRFRLTANHIVKLFGEQIDKNQGDEHRLLLLLIKLFFCSQNSFASISVEILF